MKLLSIVLMSAVPGSFAVDEGRAGLGEPIIAWRIETYYDSSRDEVASLYNSLSANGDTVSSHIVTQNSDQTITLFHKTKHLTSDNLLSLHPWSNRPKAP